MKIREFIKKIQSLPENQRKIILWLIIIIISLGLFIWWGKSVQLKIKSLEREKLKEQLKIPELQEKLKEIPKIEMPEIEIPEIPEEEWKKIEEMMKKTEEKTP